ncbi:MAG TPA: sterol desaturase family protein [Dissulfurispiraceae bacterium]|nr:sterol desaturase family protein [Dissulfurispiraceae bacterium]
MLSEYDQLSLLRSGAFWAGLLFFLMLELVRAYRQPTVSKAARWQTNLTLILANTVLTSLMFASATAAISYEGAFHDGGLLNKLQLPLWLRIAVTVVVMDFVIYFWHYVNHISPFFWRFHRVHHSDLNMDVSTASRFHIGELTGGALIKISMIKLLGIDLVSLAAFEVLLVASAQLHHSCFRISPLLEKAFIAVGVPPSMHRIHHSVVITERNSNYGTIFSCWDRLFGTFRFDVPQERIVIGMGAYRKPEALSFFRLMLMPFRKAAR